MVWRTSLFTFQGTRYIYISDGPAECRNIKPAGGQVYYASIRKKAEAVLLFTVSGYNHITGMETVQRCTENAAPQKRPNQFLIPTRSIMQNAPRYESSNSSIPPY